MDFETVNFSGTEWKPELRKGVSAALGVGGGWGAWCGKGWGWGGAAPCGALGRVPGLPGRVRKRLWFGPDPQSPDGPL